MILMTLMTLRPLNRYLNREILITGTITSGPARPRALVSCPVSVGVRSYLPEPNRGRRRWRDKKTGELSAEKAAAQRALYGNRRRARGDRGRRLQRRRGELVERPFAHQYETGVASGVGARPRAGAQGGAHPGGRLPLILTHIPPANAPVGAVNIHGHTHNRVAAVGPGRSGP